MKKTSFVSLLLALCILLGCLPVQAGAQAAGDATDPPPTEQTEPVTAPQETELAFGSVSILQGCRTIDGLVPLAGDARRLESAQAVFAFERNTGTVIYSYNADSRVAMGGLAKIVTALIVIERSGLDDIVTVNSRNISRLPAGSQNVDLKHEEQLTVRDLLHCLILKGANDAAVALAEHVAGNMEAFVALMNQRVQQIGCNSTDFATVHGLDNKPCYTTARDMARIVQEATRNETFRNLFSEVTYTVPATNRTEEPRTFESQDYLVDAKNVQKFYDERVTGGMQSASNGAGASVVYTATKRNMDLICVVMGCTRQMYENGWQVKVYGNFEEAVELLNFVFNTYKSNRVLYYGQALKQFAVSGGECNVVGAPHIDIDTVLPADCYMQNLTMYYQDNGLTAPIAKDQMIGTVQIWYRTCCVMEAELYAIEEVRLASASGVSVDGGAARKSSDSGFSRVVIIISLVILVPVAGYLGINALRRSRMQKHRRRRRSGRRRA